MNLLESVFYCDLFGILIVTIDERAKKKTERVWVGCTYVMEIVFYILQDRIPMFSYYEAIFIDIYSAMVIQLTYKWLLRYPNI